jgi:hypothetical protein
MGFMEQETEKTEYFVLFGDTQNPPPIDYQQRCWEHDLLLFDKTAYVWGYVGTLSNSQVQAVQTRFDSEFFAKLHGGYKSVYDVRPPVKHGFSFYGYTLPAMECHAKLSPNLALPSRVHIGHPFWFIPECSIEAQQSRQRRYGCFGQRLG